MNTEQGAPGGVAVFKASGRIDQNTAEAFQNALLDALAGASQGLVIDMAAVPFISSAGLRSLMVAARKAKADKIPLAIAALTPAVKEVFAISRFTAVIACHDDLATASAKLKG
ncbi:MAG: STAS domain-containing protein [Rhodospirillaceae bacterium]|nr:STAS domain-containing protein [Rhodospirillaceae bacterium]